MARKGRKRQPKPSPDQGLAPANFSALNERFYKMSPEDYFSRRLMSLMLWLGFPDGFQAALQSEFSAEGVGVQWRSDLPGDEAEKNRKRFSTADAEVILHHVSETLLRLYLVHASRSPCPWLDLARERSFAKFKKQVEKLRERLQTGEERESIQLVFLVEKQESRSIPGSLCRAFFGFRDLQRGQARHGSHDWRFFSSGGRQQRH